MMIELDILKGKSSDALGKGQCCKDQNVEKSIPRILLSDGEGEGQNVKENLFFCFNSFGLCALSLMT
jgi:hypothetical protein